MTSFAKRIFDSLESKGDRDSLIEIHGVAKRPTSAQSILEMARRGRSTLFDLDITRGDRVALLGPNSTLWAACDLSFLFHGVISVPLYSRQDPKELAFMVEDASPKLLVVSDSDLANSLQKHLKKDIKILLYDEYFSKPALEDPIIRLKEEDVVTIVYTSGTSGRPKGVVLNRGNIDFMLDQTIEQIMETTKRAGTNDHVFHFLPFCFAGSRIQLWTQLMRGNPLMMSTDLTNLKEELGTADPQYYLNVPQVLERVRKGVTDKVTEKGGVAKFLLKRGFQAHRRQAQGKASFSDSFFLRVANMLVFQKIKHLIGPRLEFLICGSAPLLEDTQQWFEMIGIPVLQVYGLTETTAIVTMDHLDSREPGYVGRIIPGVEVKVDKEGELLCKGPNLFSGYWNLPEETEKVLQNGWFYTGDQAEFSENGNLRILGRMKNILIPASGHNVVPEPIEDRLRELQPKIEHAVIIGHGRPFLTAIVTGSLSKEEIQETVNLLNTELPHYRKVRRFFQTEEPFSPENGLLTANQKLKRKEIERQFSTPIEALYQEGSV